MKPENFLLCGLLVDTDSSKTIGSHFTADQVKLPGGIIIGVGIFLVEIEKGPRFGEHLFGGQAFLSTGRGLSPRLLVLRG